MYTVYGMAASGNCYKLKLALTQLAQPFRWIEVDVPGGETRTPTYLARNPNGKVPLLEIGDGDYLAESNAILCYLADGTPLWPSDQRTRAEVLQWLFFEQYSHEPNVATVRYWIRFLGKEVELADKIAACRASGYAALKVMEQRLRDHAFLAGAQYTIADIALYAYTHVAHEGGFDLSGYPAINAWLARVAAMPHYVAME